MKITPKPNKSISAQLTDIVTSAFPLAINTGLNKDVGVIHSDPKSKGKAILFTWQKATLRLTENLKVLECDFTNTLINSDLSMLAEDMISTHLQSQSLVNTANSSQVTSELKEAVEIPLDIPKPL